MMRFGIIDHLERFRVVHDSILKHDQGGAVLNATA
jgi:hypothetical protein